MNMNKTPKLGGQIGLTSFARTQFPSGPRLYCALQWQNSSQTTILLGNYPLLVDRDADATARVCTVCTMHLCVRMVLFVCVCVRECVCVRVHEVKQVCTNTDVQADIATPAAS